MEVLVNRDTLLPAVHISFLIQAARHATTIPVYSSTAHPAGHAWVPYSLVLNIQSTANRMSRAKQAQMPWFLQMVHACDKLCGRNHDTGVCRNELYWVKNAKSRMLWTLCSHWGVGVEIDSAIFFSFFFPFMKLLGEPIQVTESSIKHELSIDQSYFNRFVFWRQSTHHTSRSVEHNRGHKGLKRHK